MARRLGDAGDAAPALEPGGTSMNASVETIDQPASLRDRAGAIRRLGRELASQGRWSEFNRAIARAEQLERQAADVEFDVRQNRTRVVEIRTIDDYMSPAERAEEFSLALASAAWDALWHGNLRLAWQHWRVSRLYAKLAKQS